MDICPLQDIDMNTQPQEDWRSPPVTRGSHKPESPAPAPDDDVEGACRPHVSVPSHSSAQGSSP